MCVCKCVCVCVKGVCVCVKEVCVCVCKRGICGIGGLGQVCVYVKERERGRERECVCVIERPRMLDHGLGQKIHLRAGLPKEPCEIAHKETC